jgi:hypothetical protein
MSRTGSFRARGTEALTEELDSLRRQKAELLDECSTLKTRIAKLHSDCERPIQAISPRILSQLDRERRDLQQSVESQKRELQLLKESDNAALRSELQEEIKLVYLESLRLEQCQIGQQRELSDLERQYNELLNQDNQEVIESQDRKIREYEEKLGKYQEANEKLAYKIRVMRANRAFDSPEGRGQIRIRAEQLRAEIARVHGETEEIQRRITEAAQKHEDEMRPVRPPASEKIRH